jgi:cyclophilin family peptidyl-prolyl cis-trans isomerase
MKYLIKIFVLAIYLISFNKAGAQTEVTFYTTKGSFKVALTDTLTPVTVDSFKARVSQKFYDGLIFHRVIDGFVVQGGDPLGTGYGGPGYTLPDEFSSPLKNIQGTIAMANTGMPHSGGSQFYFNLVNNSSLDGKYTVFGQVTTNFTVVQTIGHVPVDVNNKPLTNVYMDSIRITKRLDVPNLVNSAVVTISPNPTNGSFSIDLPAISSEVEIINIQGRTVYYAEATGTLKINLQDQPKGLYILHITNEHGTSETKLIVQ